MTHKFAKYLILATAALGLSALPALADDGVCGTVGSTSVVTGFTCTLGGLTFDFESVSLSKGGSLNLIAPPQTAVFGDDVTLDFQYTGSLPADFNLLYEVSAASDVISAVDSTFPAPADGGGDITENVCGADPLLNDDSCTPSITSVDNSTGALTFSSSFGPDSQVWIEKDVEDPSPGFSTFTDSVVATPEPSSEAALLGVGLVAFLLWKRRASASA